MNGDRVWNVVAGRVCDQCGFVVLPSVTDVSESYGRCEWYFLRNEVWSLVARPDAVLCIGCAEECLGRRLVRHDFFPTWRWSWYGLAQLRDDDGRKLFTRRLRKRLGGLKHGAYHHDDLHRFARAANAPDFMAAYRREFEPMEESARE